MRQRDVRLGAFYAAKVSGRVVPVRIDRESRYGGWDGTNMKTKRDVHIRGVQRLRFEVVRAPGCGHWVRTDRDIAAHRAQYHGEES
jgi:hypothetical protein